MSTFDSLAIIMAFVALITAIVGLVMWVWALKDEMHENNRVLMESIDNVHDRVVRLENGATQ